ncbi:2-C-methyl-D-erythritol 4-phosphate cytidylyltransferase [Humibacillus xanthopallidus]|uniref:2-C-methyl-D-erythritol 4-phosphate cytidylyltransferase n=1 Tax=Humibacillus xanthopallidus TaxID=412689 RepID=UPI0021AB7021|nr:2-C-methyl-D-erythritol 4-phosphate cytidylyltransferase [Humibacillus xanthopallidus]
MVVAAGSGSRLGHAVPKAFVPIAGLPILGHALRGVLSSPGVSEVVVVAPAAHRGEAQDVAAAVCRDVGSHADVTVVVGGAERGDSVAAGLAGLSPEVEIVLVHDAARCLTPVAVVERVVAAVAAGAVAVVPGTAVVDTIKQVDERGLVVATPERSSLRSVQTPQGFRREVLERAHAVSSAATDDAGLVERLGERVLVVDGDARAFKVTTPDDLETAARLLGMPAT